MLQAYSAGITPIVVETSARGPHGQCMRYIAFMRLWVIVEVDRLAIH